MCQAEVYNYIVFSSQTSTESTAGQCRGKESLQNEASPSFLHLKTCCTVGTGAVVGQDTCWRCLRTNGFVDQDPGVLARRA